MSGHLAVLAGYDTSPTGHPDSTLVRLSACSQRLAVLKEEYDAEKRRRDELVIQARDENSAWSKIAKAARLGISRCVAIVSGELARVFEPACAAARAGSNAGTSKPPG